MKDITCHVISIIAWTMIGTVRFILLAMGEGPAVLAWTVMGLSVIIVADCSRRIIHYKH